MWARLGSLKGIRTPLLKTELASASKPFLDVVIPVESGPILIDASDMLSIYNFMLNLEETALMGCGLKYMNTM